ncbi:hypothetical protein SAMN04487963_1716 [Marinobacter zhejiangensis]|uniref:Uncharacterized protein n=1 Tax=Marinobacter zhejiangensis TaxID=488535 RepID=A0A1I4P0E7_9GAMM|nr:hypothetical protein SAMN04487963_1716 [Marinobacter zhejiangensis]
MTRQLQGKMNPWSLYTNYFIYVARSLYLCEITLTRVPLRPEGGGRCSKAFCQPHFHGIPIL